MPVMRELSRRRRDIAFAAIWRGDFFLDTGGLAKMEDARAGAELGAQAAVGGFRFDMRAVTGISRRGVPTKPRAGRGHNAGLWTSLPMT